MSKIHHRRSDITSSYLHNVFCPERLNKLVGVMAKMLNSYKFDTIVYKGMSGAMVGPMLACKLKKQMVLIRKKSDCSHSVKKREGYNYPVQYVIVDDFVSTGDTVNSIINCLQDEGAECVGLCLYNSSESRDKDLDLAACGSKWNLFACSVLTNKTYHWGIQ